MKILIVDDEFYAVEEIVQNTHWDTFGIDKPFSAYSVKQAKSILESNPDIEMVLTDIEMPKETGIDLIEWIHSMNMNPVIMILTGHERFEYAHKAIQMHVFDYLTKPIDIARFEEILPKAVKECRRRDLYPELFHLGEENEQSQDPSDQIIDVIRKNLSSPSLNRQLIADVVHMHPDYISSLFHKKTGVSLSNYILNERLKASKVMLASTDYTLQQISANAGFSSPTYFHRQFKRTFGITPQQYRKENRIGD